MRAVLIGQNFHSSQRFASRACARYEDRNQYRLCHSDLKSTERGQSWSQNQSSNKKKFQKLLFIRQHLSRTRTPIQQPTMNGRIKTLQSPSEQPRPSLKRNLATRNVARISQPPTSMSPRPSQPTKSPSLPLSGRRTKSLIEMVIGEQQRIPDLCVGTECTFSSVATRESYQSVQDASEDFTVGVQPRWRQLLPVYQNQNEQLCILLF